MNAKQMKAYVELRKRIQHNLDPAATVTLNDAAVMLLRADAYKQEIAELREQRDSLFNALQEIRALVNKAI